MGDNRGEVNLFITADDMELDPLTIRGQKDSLKLGYRPPVPETIMPVYEPRSLTLNVVQ